MQIESIIEESEIPLKNMHDTITLSIPPWKIKQLKVNLQLSNLNKTATNPLIFEKKLNKIIKHYPRHTFIFTNGSKDKDTTGYTAMHESKIAQKHLPTETSIFSAEITVIDLTLNIFVHTNEEINHFFPHVLSVLTALKNRKLDNSLIIKLLCKFISIEY